MTKNITRIPICDGVTFHSIGEKRFKTGRLTAAMLLPLSAETASANAVLPYLLRRSCRRYPTFRALNEKLSSLYGASLQAQVYKLGGRFRCWQSPRWGWTTATPWKRRR